MDTNVFSPRRILAVLALTSCAASRSVSAPSPLADGKSLRLDSGWAEAAVEPTIPFAADPATVEPAAPAMDQTAVDAAEGVVARLATPSGFYAGNDYRQYWTRDLGYSAEVLIDLGYADTIEVQLTGILKRQKPDGSIPAMMQTREGVLHDLNPALLGRALQYRGRHALDQLGEFASNYHGVEADNPLIFLTTVKTYERLTGRDTFSKNYAQALDKLFQFIDSKVDGRGMIQGNGWTDAMVNYNGRATLNSQVWLYTMYASLGLGNKMDRTQAALEAFWNPDLGFYTDILGGDRFDSLSNAMLLDEGLVPPERVPSILAMLEKVRTPYGYLDLYPAYPSGECSQFANQYQNSTVWPFVEYRIARALQKYGKTEDVRRIQALMASRRGVNEWYSPVDGAPRGSKNQLWSAAALIGTANLLSK